MTISAEEALAALYQAAFGRSPDPTGLEAYLPRIEADPKALMTVAREIFRSDERKGAGFRGVPDHSQNGEFPRLLKQLMRTGSKYRLIVDVGARGRDRSNSYDLLLNFGWRGILVEANPALIASIQDDFAGTDFQLHSCAIGVQEGTMPFYIGVNDDVSSLRQDHAAMWGDVLGQVEVPVRRLHLLLEELAAPSDFDVLSLDIEGMDVPVLDDMIANSDFRPRHILIEASFNFATKTLQDAGCSPEVCKLYKIVDQTDANLLLALAG